MIDRGRFARAELPGDEERAMLRDSLRGFLATHWPAAGAVERGRDAGAVASIARGLAAQGLGSLGRAPEEGGLRELVVAMAELGRAACPAPLLGAALFQLATAGSATGGATAFLGDALETGAARLVWSFGGLDPSRDAGTASFVPAAEKDDAPPAERMVRGRLRFVDGGAAATHLAVVTGDRRSPTALVLVDLAATGVAVASTPALGAEGWAEVGLEDAPATVLPWDADAADDLLRIARLLAAARAHGAARRSFEMAVDYAKERRQFGQPIGRFQAIQHKLADGLIALEGVRLLIDHAALGHDLGAPDWRWAADAAVVQAGPALRRTSLETQHVFGAIGYAEEHEAPRHFRRVHLDALLFGGSPAAGRSIAARVLDGDGAPLPDDDLGPAGNAFRDDVRRWLATHWSGERKARYDALPYHAREFDPAFARDLGAAGWLSIGWPLAAGGQGRSPLEQIAFLETLERAEAPPRFGASVQANALLMFGTPEQQARYLPEIAAGEAMHGMGYSEPGAGSDLAALRTTAVRAHDAEHGDHWVIDGQKIWTTTYWGRYMFLAARTDRDATPAHAGISLFIVPMDTPGITVKTATTMYDGTFANVFYDGVRVPADALLGPLHGGWKVLTGALANERGTVGGGIVLKVVHAFDLLCADVRAAGAALRDDARVRERIAALAAEIEVGRRFMIHCAELATAGTTPPEVGAMSKVFSGELMERFGEAALDILGPTAALSQGASGSLHRGRYEQGLRHSLMWVISIGTNEIQRSLIAQRGLGLPR